jgi:hypothetical protein
MYAREKTRYMNEQFIEIFDLDLVTLPRDLPPWFIEQMQMLVCWSPWQPLSGITSPWETADPTRRRRGTASER